MTKLIIIVTIDQFLQKYNEFWWTGRVVREGSSVGYIPTPEYLEILRRTKKLKPQIGGTVTAPGRHCFSRTKKVALLPDFFRSQLLKFYTCYRTLMGFKIELVKQTFGIYTPY